LIASPVLVGVAEPLADPEPEPVVVFVLLFPEVDVEPESWPPRTEAGIEEFPAEAALFR
jgi:hypothetical protein